MTIGTHMASLNLFREADGSLEITVAGASPEMMEEWRNTGCIDRPVDHIEILILEAADRMRSRIGLVAGTKPGE